MPIRFDNRVVIVTGAGGGLGRSHALAFAARGAKVVVNDLGAARDGTGASDAAARVVEEIQTLGGEAFADGANVTNAEQVQSMVNATMARWGRVDVLVNNAGILRDKTFAKMDLADFKLVVDVHLMGSINTTKAVWDIMRQQNYGRIIMTTSSSGLYGNFGQSNYGAAKMALVGAMQSLALEGAKNDIRVNCLAPTAATRMTAGILDEAALARLAPEFVTPGALFLASENAPTRCILTAGAGGFEAANITLTRGIYAVGDDAAEQLAAQFDAVVDRTGEAVPREGSAQGILELSKTTRNPV
jgi:NAD(P)-dependent dehydrogenase (short-subunit alcohol dehydrogenase family)